MVDDPGRPTGVSGVLRFLGLSHEGQSFWEILALSGFVVGTLAIFLYASASPGAADWPTRVGLYFMVGCAAYVAGALLGFLFGVPRFKSEAGAPPPLALAPKDGQSPSEFIPNTNLEQISDWLTKIIVGATLVQVGPIVDRFQLLCVWIGGVTRQPSAELFAGATILFFFFSGFIWGYLWCSIRIFRELAKLTESLGGG
jgi:hypothetical protein